MSKKLYRLKDVLIVTGGNVYYPRRTPYTTDDIPAKYLENPKYAEEITEYKLGEQIQEKQVENVTFNSDKNISFKPEFHKLHDDYKPAKPEQFRKEEVELKAGPKPYELTETYKKAEAEKSKSINTMPLTDIEALEGVGKATAARVVERRKEAPFTSIEDLQERVPLRFGRSWKDFNLTTD
jgi:DNA uptake protein ComE-like DNA-binding protein